MADLAREACGRATVRRGLALALVAVTAVASASVVRADEAMAARVEALVPGLEAYVARGMQMFDVPGVAVGIVHGDRLVYGKGFGAGRKGGEPVGTDSVFQIGSTTKAFLAATLAIAVDRGKIGWVDRVVDLFPEFQLEDPWVTREFRVTDLMAQRSGLPPYANDMVGYLGFDQTAMIRSLRHVEPTSSFRNSFSYTNITHVLAERIVARRLGAADWPTVVAGEIFGPLGMKDSSLTAEAIEGAEKGTAGHVWTVDGSVRAPFTPIFPYGFGGAGAINSTVDDMARWLRLQLAGGTFEGRRIVSPQNLAVTRTPRIGVAPTAAYAMGWILQSTPNGQITWHNGGTFTYGAYVGLLLDRDVGIVVLSNETNVGMPDAVGEWALDRLLGNPEVDHLARKLEAAEAVSAAAAATFTRPAAPRPAPPLERLAGRFGNPNFGPVDVTRNGDGLVAEITGTGAKLALAPWDDQIFVATVVAEGRFASVAANLRPFPLGFVTFMPAPDGKVAGFRLSLQPALEQPYDFTRR
jgi:CubicO group peptidase (beta-lactamase class C family)